MDPQARIDELEKMVSELTKQNLDLSEQVKRLVRTEVRLYNYQEELDRRRRTISNVAMAGQRLSKMLDVRRILEIAADSVISDIRLERCVILCPDMRHHGVLRVAIAEGYEADTPRIERLKLPTNHAAFGKVGEDARFRYCELETEEEGLRLLRESVLMDEYVIVSLSPSEEGEPTIMIAGNRRDRVSYHARVSKQSEVFTTLALFANHVTTTLENARGYHELLLRNEEVERANRLKTAFLTTMSHELRTPLNAIIGFTRLVMRKTGSMIPERQLENLRKVEHSALGLLTIINDLLDLSKVEAGRMEIRITSVSVNAIANQVAEELSGLAKAHALQVLLELDESFSEVQTDAQRIRQVLTNLVSNAIKFTRRGTVRIRTKKMSPSRWMIAVADTGIGIPSSEFERIFEPFQQVDGGSTREVGGSGLGLAIVRQMVTLLGGTIRVESQLERGSTFIVEFDSCEGSNPPSDLPVAS